LRWRKDRGWSSGKIPILQLIGAAPMPGFSQPRRSASLPIISALYAGMLGGVSFLATPVKFLAPSLQLPVALEVGRYTFAALNKAEWVAALALFACSILAHSKWSVLAAAGIIAVLVADTFWLLPALDARVDLIMRGQWPEPSVLHYLYIGLDAVKFALLIAVATVTARRLSGAT
jgi:hypothetical protein